ncbi:unnamed protein product, partial [Mesorhabditis spiculigera]
MAWDDMQELAPRTARSTYTHRILGMQLEARRRIRKQYGQPEFDGDTGNEGVDENLLQFDGGQQCSWIREEPEMSETKGKVAIVGCGLIGSCWGAMFASAGYSVAVYEINDSLAQAGVGRIRGNLNTMQKEQLSRGKYTIEEAMAQVTRTVDLAEALHGAIYVQESTMESETFKKDIFSKMDAIAGPETILASSTSTIPASTFTETLKNRSRCLVVHPVNPPLYLSLTEVVPAPWTDEISVAKTVELMKDIGQTPVRLNREVLGFAVNRLQYALLAEAWRLVKDGVLDPEDVDKVMSEGLGPRYAFQGPLQTIHLNALGVEDYCNRYAAGIRRVLADMGPTPSFEEPEVIEKISLSMRTSVPDHPSALEQRKTNLARLAKLKRE